MFITASRPCTANILTLSIRVPQRGCPEFRQMDDTRNALSDHIDHLCKVFNLFRQNRVSLSPAKSYVGYPSVTLLGQYVDGLGMFTTKDKIAAITSLRFPQNLGDLEMFLGLTAWLRSSIERYAQRADPLQKRKVMLNKGLGTVAARSLRPGRNGRNRSA